MLRAKPLLLLVVFLLWLTSGCAMVGPDYRLPQENLPAHWQAQAEAGSTESLSDWWHQFNDPILNQLISDALAANTDLQIAQTQLRQARALRRQTGSDRLPNVNGKVSSQYSKTNGDNSSKLYNAGFDASWELDLFGKNTRAFQAALADEQASQEALRETQIGLIAEVARNYIELRTAEQRLSIADNNLQTIKDTYQLTEWRYQAGLVSELDMLQAKTQLQQTKASLPTLHTNISESRHRLAVLLNRNPEELNIGSHTEPAIPTVSTSIAASIPATVLQQRPDVRRAERELAAQTGRLGAAKAARYPSLNISGSIGLQALSLSGLGDSDTRRSLLSSISAPIFDAGRIRSNIEFQDARLEQSRLTYTATLRTALEEVENALVTLHNTQLRQQQLEAANESAVAALSIAKQQYRAGLADFQSVLESQRTLLNLQDQMASGAGTLSTAQIQLYKALGGGWTYNQEQDEEAK